MHMGMDRVCQVGDVLEVPEADARAWLVFGWCVPADPLTKEPASAKKPVGKKTATKGTKTTRKRTTKK
jgi:hypothetical protein